MKLKSVLLILPLALLMTTSAYADGNQRVTIDRKWKAVQEWKEKNDKRLKAVEKDLGSSFQEPADPGSSTGAVPRGGSGPKR